MRCEFYDMFYRVQPEYWLEPSESKYYGVWRGVSGLVRDGERVMDLGCGAGQLAMVLRGDGREFGMGVDFSPVAIEMARGFVPGCRFEVGDLYDRGVYGWCDYDCVTLTEVLEHLEDDLFVLGEVKVGAHVVFTVPNYFMWLRRDSDGETFPVHYRCFGSEEEIVARYGGLLEFLGFDYRIMDRERGWKVWIVDSMRR